MPKRQSIYPFGTIVNSIRSQFQENPHDALRLPEVIDEVWKQYPHARKWTIQANLNRLWKLGELNHHDGYYKLAQSFVGKAGKEFEAQLDTSDPDESLFFTSVDIGKHILRYVDSLKAKIDNLEETIALRDKQINELQQTINSTRLNGGLSAKEIMKGAPL